MLLTLTFACGAALASEEPASAPALGFGAPQRLRLDSPPELMQVADFNGDGRVDFAIIESQRSLLNILYSQQDATPRPPELRMEDDGDWCWRPSLQVLAVTPTAMVSGDFTGDSRPDLVLASAQDQVLLFAQNDDGLEGTPERLDERGRRVVAGDLTGNGLTDLVLLRDDALVVLHQLEEAGTLEVAARHSMSAPPADTPLLIDLDGDSHLDLIYAEASRRQNLIIRYGLPGGDFGPEHSQVVDDHFNLRGLSGGRLAAIEPNTRAIRVMQRKVDHEPHEQRSVLAQPVVIPWPTELTSGDRDMALVPMPDGGLGVLVALAEGPELMLVRHSAGRLTPQAIPSLTGIRRVVITGDAAPRALLISAKERLAASIDLTSEANIKRFPEPIETPGTPLALLPEASTGRVLVLYRENDDEDEPLQALWLDPDGAAPEASEAEELADTDIDQLRDALGADWNGDGHLDLILFFAFDDPQVWLGGELGFTLLKADNGLLRGLLPGLASTQVAWARPHADGPTQLLVARESFVRVYGLSAQNELTIAAQLSTPLRSARLSLPAMADLNGDGVSDVVCLDMEGRRLVTFVTTEGGTELQPGRSVELPDLRPQRLLTGDLDANGRHDVLVLGTRGLAVLMAGDAPGRLDVVATRLAPIDGGLYGRLFSGTLRAPAYPDGLEVLTAIEARENMLEILEPREDGFESLFRFQVFSQTRALDNAALRRLTVHPVNVQMVDVDGDGWTDLATLVHSNIIIYRQRASLSPRRQ